MFENCKFEFFGLALLFLFTQNTWAQSYLWPTTPVKKPHKIYSTLGEFRGAGGDGVGFLHSATDLRASGSEVLIYSPDTGLVRRHTKATANPIAANNPSAGKGPLRIGHFGFNHISTVFVEPQSEHRGVKLPVDWPIYVVNSKSSFFIPKSQHKNNPLKDNHFNQHPLKKNKSRPFYGFRKIKQDSYEKVVYWPQNIPVAKGISSTSDLHMIYYDTKDGPYSQASAVSNALEVMLNYKNSAKPKADQLLLHSQKSDRFLMNCGKKGRSAVIRKSQGGVTLKARAFSNLSGVTGVYSLDYEIRMLSEEASPPSTGKLNMWTFHKRPSSKNSKILIDQKLSRFENIDNKYNFYVFTKSKNGKIDQANHWELEDFKKWPDGNYLITMWIKNIKQSKGSGNPPLVNEVKYTCGVAISPIDQVRRKITVTSKLTKG